MTIYATTEILRLKPENIPSSLKQQRGFVLWRKEPSKTDATKLTKVPYKAFAPRQKASKTNPSHWSDFETAVAAVRNDPEGIAGIGWIPQKGFVAIDLDDCVDPETGEPNEYAKDVMKRHSSYTERTPSGCGLRIIVKDGQGLVTTSPKRTGKGEIMISPNYVTLTGHKVPESPDEVAEGGEALAAFYGELVGPKGEPPRHEPAPVDQPVACAIEDEEILRIARRARNREKFEKLWNGDASDYQSASEADMAMASMLAFYVGPQGRDQLIRLLKRSGLKREKHDRQDYMDRTAREAIGRAKKFYKPDSPEANLRRPATCTDMGFARRIVASLDGRARYGLEFKDWLGFDGQRFVKDQGAAITAHAKSVADQIWNEWKELPAERRRAASTHASRWSSSAGIDAAVRLARSEKGIVVSECDLDTDLMVLNLPNGVLDLRSQTLQPHSPRNLITHLADVTFDPTATAPTWERFIQEVMGGDPDLIRFLQQVSGIAVTGDVREQFLCIHHGNGRNGKSTYLNTMSKMLGTYATPGPANMLIAKGNFGREPELLFDSLKGRRFVTASETDEGAKFSEATAKLLTGGDRLLTRGVFKDSKAANPTWHIHAAVNHTPVVTGRDEGIWRRVKLIPWSQTFDGKREDPSLGHKLAAEMSGILNWCLQGLADWQANGLITPEKVRLATKRYREDSDLIGAWIAERCSVGPGFMAATTPLFEDYAQWCKANNEMCMTGTAFGIRMEERGFISSRPTSGDFRNVTIRTGISLIAKTATVEERGEDVRCA
jgi:putative DNA primase/helicase